MVSTDYPHSDGAFPEAMEQFFGLPFGDEVRHKILWDNCARLYNIDTPAAALTKEPPGSPPPSTRLSVSEAGTSAGKGLLRGSRCVAYVLCRACGRPTGYGLITRSASEPTAMVPFWG